MKLRYDNLKIGGIQMSQDMKYRFTYIKCGPGDQIIVDNETGIEYYKNGTHLIPLLDTNRKPKLNREWTKKHS